MANFINDSAKCKNVIEIVHLKIVEWLLWESNGRVTPTSAIINNVNYSSPIIVEQRNYRNIDTTRKVIMSHHGFTPSKAKNYIFGFVINGVERLVHARKVPKPHKEKYGLDFDYEFLVSPRRKVIELSITPAWKCKKTGEVITAESFIFSAPPINNAPPKSSGR